MSELKKCPFCGNSPVFEATESAGYGGEVKVYFKICCKHCQISYPEEYKIVVGLTEEGEMKYLIDERDLAVESWNKRYE